MRSGLRLPLVIAALSVLAGCGGYDPLSVLGDGTIDPSNALNLPLSDATAIQSVSAFSGSQDGIGINYVSGFGTAISAVAPAAGLIVNVDSTTHPPFTDVTIYHNARLSSKISNLQISTVRAGDYVVASQAIGTIPVGGFTLTGIKLSVFVDGSPTAVCPFSYLSASARTTYASKFGGGFPCQ
jgi:hypothetical protein